jgi:hypothetical protein
MVSFGTAHVFFSFQKYSLMGKKIIIMFLFHPYMIEIACKVGEELIALLKKKKKKKKPSKKTKSHQNKI